MAVSTPSTPRSPRRPDERLAVGDRLPGRQEPGQGLRVDRLDLLAQPGQGAAPQAAQHLGVAPLGLGAGRAELAVEHPALAAEPLQGVPDHGGPQRQVGGEVGDGERAVGAGVAGDQVAERVVDRLGEHVGDAGRHGHAERVAQPADVLDGGPALLAGHPDQGGAAGRAEPLEAVVDVGAGHGAVGDLLDGERAEEPQQVGHALDVLGLAVGGQPLQLGLDLGEHLGVEQLAQLGAAQQLGQQALVERQGGGPALGDR